MPELGANITLASQNFSYGPDAGYFYSLDTSDVNPSNHLMVKVNGVGEVRSESPKHDSTSHYRSAFEYMAIGISQNTERMTVPYDKIKKKGFNRLRSVSY